MISGNVMAIKAGEEGRVVSKDNTEIENGDEIITVDFEHRKVNHSRTI